MQSSKIEEDVKILVDNFNKEDFIYDFLLAFGFAKISIRRLREGNSNLAKKENQLIIKQKLFYEYSNSEDLYSLIDSLKNEPKTYTHKPRFIVVNNAHKLLAIDTKTNETLDVELAELHKNIEFFLPWTGKEKYIVHQENPADVKAAEKMAKIYDEIVRINPNLTKDNNHALNIFLTRLLFCFFAEDTGIFEDNAFTRVIANHTNEEGSDLAEFFKIFFVSLDKKDKGSYPSYIQRFPYVNGKLFTAETIIPKLNSKIRNLIIECGDQDWKEINPDIFGSMFQAVSVAEVRSGLGQHYTSVPNIMKVIEPLFLNDLREEFEKADTEKKLRKLLDRIYNLKIFDPACGSGNFLIIAYKQLRLLEMEIIKKIHTLPGQHPFMMSQIQLSQFYGIEIDDFACEIATLSLWLAEHQMNRKFKDIFGDCTPSLPLSKSGNIVCGNATRLDWEQVCPKGIKGITHNEMEQKTLFELQQTKQLELQGTDNEIYILGNPPYVGARKQSELQKTDLDVVFSKFDKYRDLDYISCWFYKASEYLERFNNIKCAFVSTNSICQGQQVAILWDKVLKNDLEIGFVYQAFKWTNNAKKNAGVVCIIVSIQNHDNKDKLIYTEHEIKKVKFINPYLKSDNSIVIPQTKKVISNLPKMNFGNMPNDGGGLILSTKEMETLIYKYPKAKRYIRLLIGSQEFIRGQQRYCLWLKDEDLNNINDIPEILSHIEKTKQHRLASKDKGTNKLAIRSHQFRDTNETKTISIIIPSASSSRRDYIPVGFVDSNTIVSNLALVIYNTEGWVFGVVTSHMHMVWMKAVSGQLGSGFRYSAELCYNTFPFPDITDKQKQVIEMHVNNVLAEREKHSEKTMAELYDPDKMPQGLREAHHSLDLAIEKCYRQRPFESDEKRLEYLFKLYEIMTNPTKQANVEEQLSLL